MEELILITVNLIHRITHLPLKVNNPADIAGTSSEGGLIKTVKAKYHWDKGKWGYVIASINDRAVQVATQLLAGKLMRKCHADEVPALVIALAKRYTEGVQFNCTVFMGRISDQLLRSTGQR